MVLVDKDIRSRVANNQLIVKGFNEGNLGSVSYDLTMDHVCDSKNERSYELSPGEVVFVKTQEEIFIPHDLLGRPAEKNSRMRQGLKIDAPLYHPGHRTFVYLRVQNITSCTIKLEHGMNIAQIFFEQLTGKPDMSYDENPAASFNNEMEFAGLGNYTAEYEKQIMKTAKSAEKKIEKLTDRIYPNIIALMGILVSVFSLITVNYNAFSRATLTPKFIVAVNASLAVCIAVLMGLILIFINKTKSKWFVVFYAIFLVAVCAILFLCFRL